ncbi:MAG: peptide chain release factor N(5)-glutamine methyltransferase [Victivallaceae bacterium]|nr:peptide chain release factor N(5)-glutamine methyltransferase [Victivallaceae bacterium]
MELPVIARDIEMNLGKAGVECPGAEARFILYEVLGDRAKRFGHVGITDEELKRIYEAVQRRMDGEPVQYIFGAAYFRNLRLSVTADVLIPRPETELLAGYFIDTLPRQGTLLDVGTGSGAIALSVAQERPDVEVTGVDASPAALLVAERNRADCGIGNATFLKSDLFSELSGRKFDGIAANLPYVTEDEYEKLDKIVLREPRMALVAPDGGMALMKQAVDGLDAVLAENGLAVFELSDWQAEPMAQYADSKGFKTEIRRDLADRWRFVAMTR